MSTLITVLHVIVCLFLMLTVLLQSGKGGGMGGAFGGSNAGTVFGGSGGSTFLRKLTAGAATVFMATSMVLAFIASHNSADALEKFGQSQQKLAAEKEATRKKAMQSGSAGSATPQIMMPHDFKIEAGSAGSAAPPAALPPVETAPSVSPPAPGATSTPPTAPQTTPAPTDPITPPAGTPPSAPAPGTPTAPVGSAN